MNSRLGTFIGGATGEWTIVDAKTITGEDLTEAKKLTVANGSIAVVPDGATWMLRGIVSNERYVTRHEKEQLVAYQPGLDRPEAYCAALIPIRKSASWWSMPQNERRAIFEEQSDHIKTGLKYLPAIARRLHHCRDLSDGEPFDFLTWFEYAPSHAAVFDTLLAELRASEEWNYVEREIDIRLVRDGA
jgi:chlorite dismutase